MKSRKYNKENIKLVDNDLLIENSSQYDYKHKKDFIDSKNLNYDFSSPYLTDTDNNEKRRPASYLTDKSIFEKCKCNYNNGSKIIDKWHDFFEYIDKKIKENISNGFYSFKLNDIPKEWIESTNIIIMVIRILYYKHYNCKVAKESNSQYSLLIRWDNLPDDIFLEMEDDTQIRNIIIETPEAQPGNWSFDESFITVNSKINEKDTCTNKDKVNNGIHQIFEKLFNRGSLKK